MGHINCEHPSEVELAIPPSAVTEPTSKTIRPLYDQMHALESQSCTLAAIRDVLLLKLLSGELRVGKSMKVAAEVVS